jgi:hypothetical protein
MPPLFCSKTATSARISEREIRTPARSPFVKLRGGRFPALAPLLVCALLSSPGAAFAFDRAFWVWNRSEALRPEEISALQDAGATTLFWHVGELGCTDGRWFWRTRITLPDARPIRIVPVIRLDPRDPDPFVAAKLATLRDTLREFVTTTGASEIQLDYDCPDRLVGAYATALAQLRPVASHVSATALAHWIRHPQFAGFARNVDEITPMFYDLEPDPPPQNGAPRPRPLLDETEIAKQFAAWRNCPKPWRAGLPNFSRVTLYDAAGKPRGHVRSWRWPDICFNPILRNTSAEGAGVAVFRASAEGQLANSRVAKDDSVAVRWPDRAELASAATLAEQNGAAGVVYFRLPDESDPSGWSLSQLKDLTKRTPQLLVRRRGDAFELVNESDADLPPRLEGTAGDRDRGYALEIDAPVPIWREALPGDFWRITAHATPENSPAAVPIPLSTRLTFWFSHLRAHSALRTGLAERAPNANTEALRYRVLDGNPEPVWRRID